MARPKVIAWTTAWRLARNTYEWPVPERAGPTEHEGSTSFWMYHSHVSEEQDINTGLIGPMIVTGRGKAKADASPSDGIASSSSHLPRWTRT